jgi:hypothetical protein
MTQLKSKAGPIVAGLIGFTAIVGIAGGGAMLLLGKHGGNQPPPCSGDSCPQPPSAPLDPNQLSKPLLAKLIAPQIDRSDQQWCMNTIKIKYASTNAPIANGPAPQPPAEQNQPQADQGEWHGGVHRQVGGRELPWDGSRYTDPQGDQYWQDAGGRTFMAHHDQQYYSDNGGPWQPYQGNSSTASAPMPAPPPDGFPLIFAEEAYVRWSAQDGFVMALLIGGGYIAVHEGGYPRSLIDPGTPGDVFTPKTLDDVKLVIATIAHRGAVIDLTGKGRSAGVWDAANGFCATGKWLPDDVNWTPPAPGAQGTTVSHVTVRLVFLANRLGSATGTINPMGIWQSATQEYTVVKYNDGWRLQTGDTQQAPTSSARLGDGSSQDGVGTDLGEALLAHKILSDKHGDDEENSENHDNESSGNGGGSGDN